MPMTEAFWKTAVDEAHCLLSPVWIDRATGAPTGWILINFRLIWRRFTEVFMPSVSVKKRELDLQDGTLTYHITAWMKLGFPEVPEVDAEGDTLVVHVEVFSNGLRAGGFEFEQLSADIDEAMIRQLVAMGRFERDR